jgi:hypothetical protein
MEHVRRLGREKTINFKKDFYLIVDKYRLIANASGYNGELRFQKRRWIYSYFR